MAPLPESSRPFQKLRLDTKTSHKPVASSFDSIPRRTSNTSASVSSYFPSPELAECESPIYNGERRRHDSGGHSHDHLSYDSSPAAIGTDDVETAFKKRQTSISFDSEVTLDSGNRLSIEDPLPKPAIPETLEEIPGAEDYSGSDSFVEPVNPRARLHHRIGESRYPLLQSTVDELAVRPEYSEDQDHVASLTSEATASPAFEEVRTPLELPTDYLLSPFPATSPIELPYSLFRRYGSQRSTSYRSQMSDVDGGRRTSRRSSTRSGRSLSSMSPAASFLSKYKIGEGPLKPTEPDDEGQAVGFEGEYIIGKQIGFGGFSVVKEVTTIEDGERLIHAAKIVRKQLKEKSEIENEQIQTQFDHEVEIWRFLKHPYILPLLKVYNTDFATFCITRLNKGGTLFDLVRETRRKKQKGIPLHLAKRYTYQLASAIRYLHRDMMIVHRDVKLENCLVDMTVPNADVDGGDVLLCDFGMADFTVSDQRDGPDPHSGGPNQNIGPADTSTCVAGSLQYAAPELFSASAPVFSPAADIWAFGVVVYALLTANLPFNEGLDAKTTIRIRNGEWDVGLLRDAEALHYGADDAINLMRGCLHMNPERRWTINQVLNCPWLESGVDLYEHVTKPWVHND